MSHRTPSLHFNGQQSDGIEIPYSPCKVSMNNLSCEQVRANIVQEIVATERDYVKHLKDVVEVSMDSLNIFKKNQNFQNLLLHVQILLSENLIKQVTLQ